MYAVVRIAGKQFHVRQDEVVRVPHLSADLGSDVHFDDVLAVGGDGETLVGQPLVSGARVSAQVVVHDRERKILVFHKKRRKDHRKKNGHQQPYTELRITSIQRP